MALAIITSARKLRSYFQSHTIEVLSNQPLRTVMQNTNQSGRLTKWAVELSEHDIMYKNLTAAKSQVLADFLIELTPELEQDLVLPSLNWILHVHGSSTNKGSGAGVQLQSTTGELIRQSFSFDFPASNNEAEYEALIVGLRLAKAVNSLETTTSEDAYLNLVKGLTHVKGLTQDFEFFELTKVPRGENVCADALAALGSKLHDQVKRTIPIHRIEKPSISPPTEQFAIAASVTDAMVIDEGEPRATEGLLEDWRTEFIAYLSDGTLPTEKWEARRRTQCALCRHGWNTPSMDCNQRTP
ncbi:PREDICTED: uncharacterized protein LOC106292276 [Brassica oleracea var. oleracea]|uniref:uncharacterized protein LOC106292276 n=1 Tax=Brassica oleracea var. oleracea TaxID=109376 RepID=UPI0006A6A3DE|nr:PREDICTED: uncharacterized protein LOC106292276 [Brassica oleracea var. oleracea]